LFTGEDLRPALPTIPLGDPDQSQRGKAGNDILIINADLSESTQKLASSGVSLRLPVK
jgi:hypothetical protein